MWQNIKTYAVEWFLVNKWLAIVIAALSLVVGMAIGAPANAAEVVTLSCTAPTQNTDGTPITAPITYTAHYGTSPTELVQIQSLGSACGGIVGDLPSAAPGESVTYYFGVRATVAGVQSALSNVASKTFTTDLPTPNSPTMLQVVETQAYNIRWKFTRKGLVATLGRQLGTIGIGSPCHDDFNIDGGYARVDRDAVKSAQRVLPAVIVAKCAKA